MSKFSLNLSGASQSHILNRNSKYVLTMLRIDGKVTGNT